MIIGLISDTHENVPNIIKSKQVFLIHGVEKIIHLGDIISPSTIKYFEGIKVDFIQGNNDGDVPLLKKIIESIGGRWHGSHIEFEANGKRIVGVHGHMEEELHTLIDSKHYDYILHGHTHQIRNDKISGVRVINPGAHYYSTRIKTVAILDTQNDHVEFVEIK